MYEPKIEPGGFSNSIIGGGGILMLYGIHWKGTGLGLRPANVNKRRGRLSERLQPFCGGFCQPIGDDLYLCSVLNGISIVSDH